MYLVPFVIRKYALVYMFYYLNAEQLLGKSVRVSTLLFLEKAR